MARYRIGNNLTILWAITNKDGSPYLLTNKDVKLYVTHQRGREEVSITTQDNVVRWDFLGETQRVLGAYTLTVEISEKKGTKNITKDYCAAFTLVGKTCEESAEDDYIINESGEILLTSPLDVYKLEPTKVEIGPNGNWFIGGVDSGYPASGGAGLIDVVYKNTELGKQFNPDSVIDTFNAHTINEINAKTISLMNETSEIRDTVQGNANLTERRFESAEETLSMLQNAFKNFSVAVNPVSVHTMSLLVGDKSLQFIFTNSADSLTNGDCPLVYHNDVKKLIAQPTYLKHMTLNITDVVAQRNPSDYLTWQMPTWESGTFTLAEQAYYIYAKVAKTSQGTNSYEFSVEPIDMEPREDPNHYYFLVGILNSEYNGARDFVTLYGFTEVLPGQITTDIIRDGDNNLVIDLTKATITANAGAKISGVIEFKDGSSGLDKVKEWDVIAESSRLNLLVDTSELVLTATNSNTFQEFAIPLTVSTGDKFVFKAEIAELIKGSAAAYTIRMFDPTLTTVYAETSLAFGNNQTANIEVTAAGISNAKAKLLIYAGGLNATSGKAIRLTNFSLVKGTQAMHVWEDYQGDNGLSNLLNLRTAEVLTIGSETSTNNSYNEEISDIRVNPGETYTFMIEKSQFTSSKKDTGFNFGLYSYDKKAFLNEGGLRYMQVGNFYYSTLTINSEVADGTKAVLLVYPGQPSGSGTSGKVLELTRASLVKGKRPMMKWMYNTYSLQRVFKDGTTAVNGGLIMTQSVMVEDGNGKVKGMINGSTHASDSTHGRLIVAAGSNSGSEGDMKAAKTRLYEDGHIVAKSAEIEGTIVANTTTVPGKITIAETGLIFQGSSKGVAVAQQSSGLVNVCADTALNSASASHNIGIRVRSNGAAIYSDNGMFFGLRPRSRVVTSGATLEDTDYNLFIDNGTIYLPKTPLTGQTYRIYHTTTSSLTIAKTSGSTATLYVLKGSAGRTSVNTITSAAAELIELVFAGSNWYATKSIYE